MIHRVESSREIDKTKTKKKIGDDDFCLFMTACSTHRTWCLAPGNVSSFQDALRKRRQLVNDYLTMKS